MSTPIGLQVTFYKISPKKHQHCITPPSCALLFYKTNYSYTPIVSHSYPTSHQIHQQSSVPTWRPRSAPSGGSLGALTLRSTPLQSPWERRTRTSCSSPSCADTGSSAEGDLSGSGITMVNPLWRFMVNPW